MSKQAFNPADLPNPPGFSQVVRAEGVTVYVSGQTALDENGILVGRGDFEAQVNQVFANLVRALDAAGATPDDVVKLGIYVVHHDEEKLEAVRVARDALGLRPPPASTLLGVERLARPEFLVEVDAIAVIG